MPLKSLEQRFLLEFLLLQFIINLLSLTVIQLKRSNAINVIILLMQSRFCHCVSITPTTLANKMSLLGEYANARRQVIISVRSFRRGLESNITLILKKDVEKMCFY